jgi:hypothetical protein
MDRLSYIQIITVFIILKSKLRDWGELTRRGVGFKLLLRLISLDFNMITVIKMF